MIGRVVSVKNQQAVSSGNNSTVTVLVKRVAMHPLYKKTFIRSKKYLVEDKKGVKIGDLVEIINCKPVSGNKHWSVTNVLGRNLAEITEEILKEAAQAAISEVMPEEKVEETGVKSQESGKEKVKAKKGKKSSL